MTVNLSELYTPKSLECDNCNKIIGKVTVKKERLTKSRNGYYFTCDKCGYKYPFAAISDEGERLLNKINGIKKSKTRKDKSKLERYMSMYYKEFQSNYTKEDVLNGKREYT